MTLSTIPSVPRIQVLCQPSAPGGRNGKAWRWLAYRGGIRIGRLETARQLTPGPDQTVPCWPLSLPREAAVLSEASAVPQWHSAGWHCCCSILGFSSFLDACFPWLQLLSPLSGEFLPHTAALSLISLVQSHLCKPRGEQTFRKTTLK